MNEDRASRTAGFSAEDGYIDGCTKDRQTATPQWHLPQQLIDGVIVKEVKNVIKGNGALTELFVQVLDGVKEGERVVTKGAYAIRLSYLSGVIPSHGHAH